MKALGRPELVARVVGHALIAKDHMIGDESDGRKLALVEIVDEEEMATTPDVSESESSEGSMAAVPQSRSSYKRPREDDGMAAVVSDDEPSLEWSPSRSDRLNLAYILA
ncbi:hypothetical protein PI124_g15760 [Phytophthora idaei]|nr:hypothetical protein PI126_g14770 [Phytophthora idaei]KAG3239303.1 hypothetical protein PI124_g15760 [Phytophthora idaei]